MRGSTYWFITVLGLISNTLAVISLIKNGYEIKLIGVWEAIYSEYRALANLFYGISFDFLFDIELPRWTQDILTIYLISNALIFRSIRSRADRYLSKPTVAPGEDGYEKQEASRNIRLLVNMWTFPVHLFMGPASHVLGMMIVQQIHRVRLWLNGTMDEEERKYREGYVKRPVSNIMYVTARNVWPEYVKQLLAMIVGASTFFYFNYVKLFYADGGFNPG